MTIEFNHDREQVINRAIQAGLIQRADQVVEVGLEALRDRLTAGTVSGNGVSAEEWMGKFRAWAHSHPTTTPLLSDEAVGRESIYRERGL